MLSRKLTYYEVLSFQLSRLCMYKHLNRAVVPCSTYIYILARRNRQLDTKEEEKDRAAPNVGIIQLVLVSHFCTHVVYLVSAGKASIHRSSLRFCLPPPITRMSCSRKYIHEQSLQQRAVTVTYACIWLPNPVTNWTACRLG
jgi:hypothetical protein